MLIRKNTKEFKAILQIFLQHSDAKPSNKFFNLFIVKAGEKINNKISIETLKENKEFYWASTLQTVLDNLQSSNHQLHFDEDSNTYYFHTGQNKSWDETPFQISDTLRKKFTELAAITPKKTKKPVEVKQKHTSSRWLPGDDSSTVISKKNTPSPPKTIKEPVIKKIKEKEQPSKIAAVKPIFKTKHPIEFHDLDKIVFPELGIKKIEVLRYYDTIVSTILPYLKNRPLSMLGLSAFREEGKRLHPFNQAIDNNIPEWIKLISASKFSVSKEDVAFLCPDKDHLLWMAEVDCLELNPSHAQIEALNFPDYLVIVLDDPLLDANKIVEVAIQAKVVLDALKITALLKTSGFGGFHLYIPLDRKSNYKECYQLAEFLCKLIHLKIPSITTLEKLQDPDGLVYLNYQHNGKDATMTAPYSLVPNDWAGVSAPLQWKELKKGFDIKSYDLRTTLKRLQKQGDLFSGILKNKNINASQALKELQIRYGFLL